MRAATAFTPRTAGDTGPPPTTGVQKRSLGLLLDLDQGSMTVYKCDEWLGGDGD